MTKLYLVTEHSYGEEITFLDDHEPRYYTEREDYKLTWREATFDEVTLDDLLSAIEGEMENANHHREMEIPNFLSKHLLKHLPEDKVKQIFWDMVQEKGLLLF